MIVSVRSRVVRVRSERVLRAAPLGEEVAALVGHLSVQAATRIDVVSASLSCACIRVLLVAVRLHALGHNWRSNHFELDASGVRCGGGVSLK
jgi:hypothetical protein